MSSVSRRLHYLRSIPVVIVLVLFAAFLVTSTVALMSDTSVHGLATKVFYVDRFCESNPATLTKTVKFYIVASVWSSSSLPTSIKHVEFSLLADGVNAGTFNATDEMWNPGQGASYTFTIPDSALNPFFLPATSNLVLSVTAQVSAGIASAQVTASDSSVQNFRNTSC